MNARMFVLAAVALLAAGAFAGDARADWEYTRFGMSPEQVVAASNGMVRLGAPPKGREYQGLTGRAVGVYQGDGASFQAFFHFDGGNRLVRVALERIDGAPCATLNARLKQRHGAPVSNNNTSFATIERFNDRARGNAVNFVHIGELPCTITYDRLR